MSSSPLGADRREPNLDLVRAAAIVLVLVHHIGQLYPDLPDFVRRYLAMGTHGVDLFFVLSGWLIGGIYWREQRDFGNVEVGRFWARRWLRTLPPYFPSLFVAFLGVYFLRGESFDWRYVVFLQNYSDQVPFFLVSWSLCVEEHFYLLLPILILLAKFTSVSFEWALLSALSYSLIARAIDPFAEPGGAFGYSETASHLNLTGLALGVWLSYVKIFRGERWVVAERLGRSLLVPLIFGATLLPFAPADFQYYIGDSYISVLCACVVVALVGMPALSVAKSRLVYFISISSYSIYLTHSVVLHAGQMLTNWLDVPRGLAFTLWVPMILAVGWFAFILVERPALGFRDRFVPKRKPSAQFQVLCDPRT